MRRNVGNFDRLARIVVGFGIATLAFVGPQQPWFLAGLILVVTGVVGYCPPYQLFGISTYCPAPTPNDGKKQAA